MPYYIEVKIKGEYEKIRPSGGKPYEFKTREEAWSTARTCYPDQIAFGGDDGKPCVRITQK